MDNSREHTNSRRFAGIAGAGFLLVTLWLGLVLALAVSARADEQQTAAELQALSSARQLDLQIQELVKTLSQSLVTVQIASQTSPFQSTVVPKSATRIAPPIYLRNISAIAVDSGGYLICAAALLSDQDSVWLIRGGIRYPVERVGIDYRSGMALLKTPAPNLLAVNYVQRESARGSLALFLKAAGAESIEPTLTFASGASTVDGYLEFTCPVGSGTVGGAFFNLDGHLLGIALGSLSRDGSSNQVFVLPVSRIEPIVTRLKCCGDREAGYLGVQVVNTEIHGLSSSSPSTLGNNLAATSITRYAGGEQSASAQSESTNGALITIVEPESPAQKAGLLVGDVIFRYDDQAVISANGLRDYVRGCAPDSVISLTFLRGNQQLMVSALLSKAPLVALTSNGSSPTELIDSDNPSREDYQSLLERIRQLESRLQSLEGNQ